MSANTKLIMALGGTALLAASMVTANLCGAIAELQWAVALTMGLCLAWGFTLALSLGNSLRRIGAACREISPGSPASVTKIVQGDELTLIEATLKYNKERYRELASTVSQGLDALIAQSTGLTSLAQQTTENLSSADEIQQSVGARIKTLSLDAASIASRFGSLPASMDAVTDTARESAEQVGIIINATNKMNVTITDIAINAEKARDVAGTAVSKVNAASNRVDELGAAALEINKVTDVIVEIAEQTKLLALNATIEAARAGEAGKGFAVVANEVKELALQTNNAIAEIRNKVEAMQHSTDNTIAEIGAISQTINAVNEIVVTIAGAVEEQSIPTKEIVRQLNQGVNGINTIRETVRNAATAVGETADHINQFATTSQEIAAEIVPASQQHEGLSPRISAIKQQSSDLQSASQGLLAKIKSLSDSC